MFSLKWFGSVFETNLPEQDTWLIIFQQKVVNGQSLVL